MLRIRARISQETALVGWEWGFFVRIVRIRVARERHPVRPPRPRFASLSLSLRRRGGRLRCGRMHRVNLPRFDFRRLQKSGAKFPDDDLPASEQFGVIGKLLAALVHLDAADAGAGFYGCAEARHDLVGETAEVLEVVGIAVVGMPVVGTAVVGTAVVGTAVVGTAVVGTAVVG